MRELLRELDDRLGEVTDRSFESKYSLDIRNLKQAIRVVLSRGYFDGSFTGIDMRQMPPVL